MTHSISSQSLQTKAGSLIAFLWTFPLELHGLQFNSTCPCIATPIYAEVAAGRSDATFFNASVTLSSAQYPVDYGSLQCKEWDSISDPKCQGEKAEAYCEEPWCYVDVNSCHESEVPYMVSTANGYAFSYGTCRGDASKWMKYTITSKLEGKILRYAYPMSYYPNFYRNTADGKSITSYAEDKVNGIGDYQGIFPEFWARIIEAGKFTAKPQFVSVGSRTVHSSSWTACVADVQRGILDICPGDFWNTQERYGMTSFSKPLYTTKYYLMVLEPKDKVDVSSKMVTVFKPFVPSVWLLIVAAVFSTAFFYTIMKTCTGELHQIHGAASTDHKVAPKAYIKQFGTEAAEKAGDLLNGKLGMPDNIGGKMVRFGWGGFAVLILAAFQANLTAFLVKKDVVMPIKNINDCIDQRCRLCVDKYRIKDMMDTYGRKIDYMEMSQAGDVIKGVVNEECKAGLVEEGYYSLKNDLQHAELVYTGTSVLSYFVGFPVSDQYRDAISYVMLSLETSADAQAFKGIREKHLPGMKYDPWRDPMAEQDRDTQSLSAADLSAPFMILLGTQILGFLFLGADYIWRTYVKHRKETEDDVENNAANGGVSKDDRYIKQSSSTSSILETE